MRLIRTATVAVALACSCVAAPSASAQPAPGPAPGPTPAADAPKTTIDGNGTYAVGKDIVPGVYQSAGPVDNGACYWKRSAGDKLVDNALTKKPAFVQVDATDTSFTTSDCQTWQLTNGPMPPQPGPGDLLGALTQAIGSGMFNGGPR
ncbi:hypothetical protein FK535_01545 [Mycolicibacterium sp. 018/SC-01/001]|uniref:hypothetical protein n=1 Tax=Mycolicibacterium sp. 018/SC-01/001 TaxID=2592069 RepID=UPI001180A02B|nr:hypothetical protein [Mycolicibacterium sp. 018/SC-01/001]TRW88980.1 hypothetical protein FK535_01545 [Mycolicibacterium sp. 018/SC-01/001]